MLVSLQHRIAILSTPKCASSALSAALAPEMDLVMAKAPGLKHTSYRRFDRFLRPLLEKHGGARIETVCLFREPMDWLHSWWRYRSRPGIPESGKTTRGMAFSQFVGDYLDGRKPPADIGRQSRFVADKHGAVAVDRIFRYDRMENFVAFLSARLATDIQLEHRNRSPGAPGPDTLASSLRARAETELAADFRIYRTRTV